MKQMDLICVGEILVDFLPGELPWTYMAKPGGAPANVAVAAARNGLKVGMCGRVGNDSFGRFLIKTLKNNGVDFLCPDPVESAVTTMAFASLDDDGDRSFTFVRKPGADCFLTAENVSACGLERARMVHAGSCSLSEEPAAGATVYAIRQAKSMGRLVSFDVNYRETMWHGDRERAAAAVKSLLPYIDLLKYSDEDAQLLGLNELDGPELVVETRGSRGALMHWKGMSRSVPGRKVQCVDATGAGDAFWGAFLSYLLGAGVSTTSQLSMPLLTGAMDYANVAGSLCVQKKGAMESLPTRAEIEKLTCAVT